MRRLIGIVLLSLVLTTTGFSQYTKDTETIDSIIHALYEVISGDAGVERDWDRMRNLFIPEGRLMPTGVNEQGQALYLTWTVNEYIDRVEPLLLEEGFHERELSREVERFRNIAHVFSTYDSKRTVDGEVIARGINSIQLFYDNERWWIVSVFWSAEQPGHPIPMKYLKGDTDG